MPREPGSFLKCPASIFNPSVLCTKGQRKLQPGYVENGSRWILEVEMMPQKHLQRVDLEWSRCRLLIVEQAWWIPQKYLCIHVHSLNGFTHANSICGGKYKPASSAPKIQGVLCFPGHSTRLKNSKGAHVPSLTNQCLRFSATGTVLWDECITQVWLIWGLQSYSFVSRHEMLHSFLAMALKALSLIAGSGIVSTSRRR